MSLGTSTKYVNIVIRVKGYFPDKDKIKQWCIENCEIYCFMLHVEDINPDTGIKEDPHCHIVADLNVAKRLSTTLNSLCTYLGIRTTGVQIQKYTSYGGSIRYLTHKKEPLKTQHSISEYISNLPIEELQTIIDTDDNELTAEYLISLCRKSHFLTDIIRALGLGRFNMYRSTILIIWEDMKKFRNGDIYE